VRRTTASRRDVAWVIAIACLTPGCVADDRQPAVAAAAEQLAVDADADVRAALDTAFARLAASADTIDEALRPVPLLTPAQEAGLRRYGNAEQLERARALGERPGDSASIEAAIRDGRLVTLEDSTEHWVVHELEHSIALVTPDTRALLADIGRRFQGRTADLGLPPYRLEVTSVLRTAALQADLRATNPNAAAGASAHEYGTTLDIAYSSFPAPADAYTFASAGPAWLAPYLDRIAAAVLEAAAARKSRELQAILGGVLRELQDDGQVMVTLERQQPVYHITNARVR
jgi:hypothetical protein